MNAGATKAPVPWVGATAVIVIALTLRVVWITDLPIIPTSDGTIYDLFARRLAADQGYTWTSGIPSARWPVGTAFVYSLAFRFADAPYRTIAAVHVALALILIAATMALADRWFSRGVGLMTGLLLALWPGLIEFTTVLASENVFLPLIAAALWAWTNRSWSLLARGVTSGVLLAAASYMRPVALLLPIVWSLPLMTEQQHIGRVAATTITALLVMAVLIAPWSIRNTRIFGQFTLISTNGGVNLWIGNHPGGDGTYAPAPSLGDGENEAQRDRRVGAEARRYIIDAPGQFVLRTLRKAVRLHDRETIGVVWNAEGLAQRFGPRVIGPLKLISTAYWWAVLLAAIAAIVRLALRRGWGRTLSHPAVITWIYFATLHSVMETQDRFHYPSVPFIAALAALTLTPITQRWVGFPPLR